jgi:hypothetical protein
MELPGVQVRKVLKVSRGYRVFRVLLEWMELPEVGGMSFRKRVSTWLPAYT